MTKQPNALEAARELIEGKPISNPNVTVQELCRVYLAAEARIRLLESALLAWDAWDNEPSPETPQKDYKLLGGARFLTRRALAKEETPA